MIPNPIQLSEVKAYVDLYGPPSMEIGTFIELIGMMDIKSLELTSKKTSHGNHPASNG